MKLSDNGAKLIAEFEGFRSCPYRDAVGVWTIGYGSTRGVGPNTKCITRSQALDRMKREVDERYGKAVNDLKLPLNQNQFDALTSFVYNVGPGGVGSNTGVGRALRQRHWNQAANELLKWDKAGGRTLPGLTRRRKAERELFLRKPAFDWSGYTASEKRWIQEYDRLLKDRKDPDRRGVLRRVMTDQRKRIWRAAQPKSKGGDGRGWSHANRQRRYNSLLARTK